MHVITIFYIHMSFKQHVFLGPTSPTFWCLCSVFFFPKNPNPGRISFLRQSWRKKSIDSRRTRWDLRLASDVLCGGFEKPFCLSWSTGSFLSFLKFLKPPERRFQTIFDNTSYCGEILQLFTLSTLWIQLFASCHVLMTWKNAEKSEPLASTTLTPSIARESNWRVATCSTDRVVQPAGHTKSFAASLPRKKRPRCVVGWSWIQLQDFGKGIAKLRRIGVTLHFECPILREITKSEVSTEKMYPGCSHCKASQGPNLLQGYISCATGWANGDQGTSVGHVGEWSSDHFCTSFYAKLLISYDVFNHRSHIIILKYDRMGSTM